MTIKKALQTIKGYCEKHTSCNRCLLKSELHCLLEEDIPADWDVDEMLKKQRGDSDDS